MKRLRTLMELPTPIMSKSGVAIKIYTGHYQNFIWGDSQMIGQTFSISKGLFYFLPRFLTRRNWNLK